ncbi:sensor histidine kinase [Paenibacillaceae bacterium WGS1546]|uniref:cache domain-containing sensor histidine kinase n=1 Tax=Cohnella sp. WGS1546 TaxID=3366810 RepID=UPI00372D3C58
MSRELQKQAMDGLNRLGMQLVSSIEAQMESVEKQTWGYFSNTELQDMVLRAGEQGVNVNMDDYLRMIETSLNNDSAIGGIYIYDNNGTRLVGRATLARVPDEVRRRDNDRKRLQNLAAEHGGKGVWTSMISLMERPTPEVTTIGHIKQLKKITNFSHFAIGWIQLEIREEWVRNVLRGLKVNEEGLFALIDEEGRVLIGEGYDRQQARQPALQEWVNRIADKDAGSIVAINGEDHLTIQVPFHKNEWRLVAAVPRHYATQGLDKARKDSAMLSIVSLIAAMIVGIVIARKITRPLKRLRAGMQQVGRGNYQVQVAVDAKHEIGYLGRSFNAMASEIHRLITKVYEKELLRREAEFLSLQARINPHFLYNALSAIDGIAELHRERRISTISRGLAAMFRYSISEGVTATLRDEIKHLEIYLKIQQLRYGDRIRSEVRIDPDVESVIIPKLVLQPLVENAIIHGVERKLSGGKIAIAACRLADGQVEVRIADNGSGMEQARLQEVCSLLADPVLEADQQEPVRLTTGRKTSIGLKNVYQRLRIHFEKRAEMWIESEFGRGTAIVITLPIDAAKEEEQHESSDGGGR